MAEFTQITPATLRARREAAGLTRPRLCALAGCSLTTLANFEAGVPAKSRAIERAVAALDALEQANRNQNQEEGTAR